jgi:hypothetical protein
LALLNPPGVGAVRIGICSLKRKTVFAPPGGGRHLMVLIHLSFILLAVAFIVPYFDGIFFPFFRRIIRVTPFLLPATAAGHYEHLAAAINA